MNLYVYVCNFCGDVLETTRYLGRKIICGKCKREAVLQSARREGNAEYCGGIFIRGSRLLGGWRSLGL